MTLLSAAMLWPARAVKAQTPAAASNSAATAAHDPAVVDAAEDGSDRMTVPVMVNGQGPYPFIVDTASDRTTVSQTLAETLNLPAKGTLNVDSATGLDVVPSVEIDRLQVGSRQIRRIRAPVFRQHNIGAAGLLGIDALAEQNIVMDFRTNQMTVQPSAGHDEPGDIVVSGRSRYGQLILVDASVGGRDLFVVIDTGGQTSIGNSVLRKLVQNQSLSAQAADEVNVISVSGDTAKAQIDVLAHVRLGGIQVSNLPIAYADIHTFDKLDLRNRPSMLLGMDILRKFDRVSVDFKARRVRFLLPKDRLTRIPD
ncbi:MAG TPA: aspartyl protease family protein [Caulobacteraceae bacterium]|nr:aspartyl protease family protein [Caulobacteraceae bacterium]